MPSVGAVTFAFVQRSVFTEGEAVKDVTRPGVDGVALKKIGTRGGQYQLSCTRGASSKPDIKTQITAIMALKGTIVSIVDDHTNTWTSVAIREVRIVKVKGVTQVVGPMAGSVAIITASITGQDTGAP